MNSWRQTTIGDLVSLKRGYDLTRDERSGGNIPVMGAAGENGFHDVAKVKGPGIVLGRSGGSFGKAHFVEGDFWPHNTAMYVTDFKGNDPYFLFYLFKNLDFKNFNSGSAQPSLNRNYVYPIKVIAPNVHKQKEIGSILKNIDSKIELNNRINAELEALAKTIYDYWFVQFDFPISAAQAAEMGKPELAGKPYKSSGGAMVWNEQLKREVPKGWGSYPLSEIGNVVGGSTPSKSRKEFFTDGGSGIPWITPKDLSVRKGKRFISCGEYDVTEAGRKSASLKVMPKGTVLLSSRAPVGYMAIAREPVTTNQGFKSLVPVEGFSTEYVFLTVELYLPAIIKKASGSTFAEISASTLKTVEIVAPPQELIEKFTATVAPMFAKQDVLEQENQELASLRDWLLPMLMNGQVTFAEASVTEGEEIGQEEGAERS